MGRNDVDRLDARSDLTGLAKAAGSDDPGRREAALECLERRLPSLVDGLASRDMRVVRRCRAALAALGEPAVGRLAEAAQRGPTPRRQDAVFALGVIGLPSTVVPLGRALRDADPLTRLMAVEALLKVKDADDDVRPLVDDALDDADPAVALAAKRGLRKLVRRAR